MSHVSSEQLWDFAAKGLSPDGAATVRAHLEFCPACQAQLDDVRQAQALVAMVPEPPPMPEAMARRVAAALTEHAEAAHREPWWKTLFRFDGFRGLALASAVAAVLLAFVAANLWPRPAPPQTPEPVAKQDVPVTPPPPVVKPAPVPPARRQVATVASAKRASSRSAALAKAQVLESGATVKTEAGGSVWMQLPDGTRAGVAGSTEVQLASLTEKALTLEVTHGSLAMLVPHREDRVLTVRAGEVEVKDLGTRFVVSRELGRVLVAVEEGSVQVNAPGRVETLHAGQAADWNNGQLKVLLLQPRDVKPAAVAPETPPIPAPVEPAVDGSAPASAARLEEQDDAPPPQVEAPVAAPVPPPTQANARPDEEWVALPPSGATGATGPAPLPAPPAKVTTATPKTISQGPLTGPFGRDVDFTIRAVEQQVEGLRREAAGVANAVSSAFRQAQAGQIRKSAAAGDCETVLRESQAWIASSTGQDSLAETRELLGYRARCLTFVGRAQEAAQVQKRIDELGR